MLAQEFWFTVGADKNAADIGNATATVACNVVNTRSLEDVLKELRGQDDESTAQGLESELAYAVNHVDDLKRMLKDVRKRKDHKKDSKSSTDGKDMGAEDTSGQDVSGGAPKCSRAMKQEAGLK